MNLTKRLQYFAYRNLVFRFRVFVSDMRQLFLRTFFPYEYQCVREPIWIDDPYTVFHDYGSGFLVTGDDEGCHFESFDKVVAYVRGD